MGASRNSGGEILRELTRLGLWAFRTALQGVSVSLQRHSSLPLGRRVKPPFCRCFAGLCLTIHHLTSYAVSPVQDALSSWAGDTAYGPDPDAMPRSLS